MDFQTLLGQARAGNATACTELCLRYSSHLHRIIRRHLNQHLRRLFDSFDLLQDVWQELFHDVLPCRSFQTHAHFLRFLAILARNKTLKLQREQVETQCHSLAREIPLETCSPGSKAWEEKRAGPERIAEAKDEWDLLLRSLPERYRSVLLALRETYGLKEAARALHISLRTLLRDLKVLRQRQARLRPSLPE